MIPHVSSRFRLAAFAATHMLAQPGQRINPIAKSLDDENPVGIKPRPCL
jgi:hypothetical protein